MSRVTFVGRAGVRLALTAGIFLASLAPCAADPVQVGPPNIFDDPIYSEPPEAHSFLAATDGNARSFGGYATRNIFDDPAYQISPEEHSFAASAEEFFQRAGGIGGLTHKAATAAKEAGQEATIAQFQGREPAPAGAFPTQAQYDEAIAGLSASEAARLKAEAYHVEGVMDALGMLVGSGISAATDPIAAILAVPSAGTSQWGLAGLRAIGLDQAVTHIAEAAFPKAAPLIGETAAHVVAGAPGGAVFGAGYEAAGQGIEIAADRQAALDKAKILFAFVLIGGLGAGLGSLLGLARLAKGVRGEGLRVPLQSWPCPGQKDQRKGRNRRRPLYAAFRKSEATGMTSYRLSRVHLVCWLLSAKIYLLRRVEDMKFALVLAIIGIMYVVITAWIAAAVLSYGIAFYGPIFRALEAYWIR